MHVTPDGVTARTKERGEHDDPEGPAKTVELALDSASSLLVGHRLAAGNLPPRHDGKKEGSAQNPLGQHGGPPPSAWLVVTRPRKRKACDGDEQSHSELQLLCLLNLDLLRAVRQPETLCVTRRMLFSIHVLSLPLSNTIPYLAIKSKRLTET